MSVKIPKHLEKQREVKITKEELISFETEVKENMKVVKYQHQFILI